MEQFSPLQLAVRELCRERATGDKWTAPLKPKAGLKWATRHGAIDTDIPRLL